MKLKYQHVKKIIAGKPCWWCGWMHLGQQGQRRGGERLYLFTSHITNTHQYLSRAGKGNLSLASPPMASAPWRPSWPPLYAHRWLWKFVVDLNSTSWCMPLDANPHKGVWYTPHMWGIPLYGGYTPLWGYAPSHMGVYTLSIPLVVVVVVVVVGVVVVLNCDARLLSMRSAQRHGF